jgi:hypothetical protein
MAAKEASLRKEMAEKESALRQEFADKEESLRKEHAASASKTSDSEPKDDETRKALEHANAIIVEREIEITRVKTESELRSACVA